MLAYVWLKLLPKGYFHKSGERPKELKNKTKIKQIIFFFTISTRVDYLHLTYKLILIDINS